MGLIMKTTLNTEKLDTNMGEVNARSIPIPVPEFLDMVNQNGKKRISREKVYRMLKNGELPSYRLGRKILGDPDEIFAAMRQERMARVNGNYED